MIDIHTHVLNHIDDGADTLQTSLLMCAAAAKAGSRAVIATPHFMEGTYEKASKDSIYQKVRDLNLLLVQNRVNLSVYPGCEAFITFDLPQYVKLGQCATLNGSSYILVELPPVTIPLYMNEVIYELEIQGFTPVLAHPERNRSIIHDPSLIRNLINRGVLVQINAGSLTGQMGSKVRRTAWKLLEDKAVHFIASDAHNLGIRSPGMLKAYDLVCGLIGSDNADLLFKINPGSVVNNSVVQEIAPIRKRFAQEASFFFNRLF